MAKTNNKTSVENKRKSPQLAGPTQKEIQQTKGKKLLLKIFGLSLKKVHEF